MAVLDLFKRLAGTNVPVGDRRNAVRMRASVGARVLVVDDSATIRAVLGKMLVQDGYEVLKAADGEGAVSTAQTQFPDLIFLDIVLPGISGFAVLRALRRDNRTRTTPIIMMSGNQQATEQFYVQRFGADGFVKKPFGRIDVFNAVRALVQAGRMPARLESMPVDALPEGMTQEEWNAIPDIGMPDDAHAVPVAVPAAPPAAQVRTEPAARHAPAPAVPHANRSVTVAVPVEPMHLDADALAPLARGLLVSAASMPMRRSDAGGIQAASKSTLRSMVMHVRPPKPLQASGPNAGSEATPPGPEVGKH